MRSNMKLRPVVVALMASGVLLSSVPALADGITAGTQSAENSTVDVGQINAAAQGASYLGAVRRNLLVKKPVLIQGSL
ncbi:hypothetical protein [Acidithiobacillus sp.]|uniref:hypothetical protein n=1 Tax=Acidithiobacillus sp. TaxID=1872118 RepID=UPI003D023013